MPPPPEIVFAKSDNCGRSIKVNWNSPFTRHELQLNSMSGTKGMSVYEYRSAEHLFDGLSSNTIYKVKIRAISSSGSGLWAKREIRTTAGIIM